TCSKIKMYFQENFPFHTEFRVAIALYKDVENSKQLRNMIMDGAVEAALIKPSQIIDKTQLLSAANIAVHLHSCNKKITRNVHSEVLYSLSPTKQITNSFKTFGIQDNDSELVAVVIHERDVDIDGILAPIDGTRIDIDEISNYTNETSIKKTYKVTEPELHIGTLLDAVLTRMATKNIISFDKKS
ncbi:unnamed protein product, partial [Owenia fusiformis]